MALMLSLVLDLVLVRVRLGASALVAQDHLTEPPGVGCENKA